MVPFCMMRNSLLGVVMLWEIDLLPFRKKVSGVQILLTIRLLSRRISMGPSNFSRSSIQVWRKNTSMVYSLKGGVVQWGLRIYLLLLQSLLLLTAASAPAATPLTLERMTDGRVSHAIIGTCWTEYWQREEPYQFIMHSGVFCCRY